MACYRVLGPPPECSTGHPTPPRLRLVELLNVPRQTRPAALEASRSPPLISGVGGRVFQILEQLVEHVLILAKCKLTKKA